MFEVNFAKFKLRGQLNYGLSEKKVTKKESKTRKSQAKERYLTNASQLFNFSQNSYLERTSRPIYAIWFLLPFIVFYEIGTIWINTDVLNQMQVRVVAFVWLRELLESIGFGGKIAWVSPPLVVIAILLGLQFASRKRWSFVSSDILPMGAECIVMAVPLLVLSLFLNSPSVPQGDANHVAAASIQMQSYEASDAACAVPLLAARSVGPPPRKMLLAEIVTGIGAGIYEELVFRLILICLLMMLFQDALRLSHKSSIILSVLISAALFSAHHHIVFLDGQFGRIADFNWTKFSFRTMAGIYFSMLFAIRGFGITAGTHAFYNIIATVLNVFFFQA
jgi:hypothetical protein